MKLFRIFSVDDLPGDLVQYNKRQPVKISDALIT